MVPRPGLELNRRYRLVEVLGRGGMGQVWSALDLELERRVAIKLVPVDVPSDAAPELLARLRREARTAGRLQHPGITAVYDLGRHDGAPYVVMELLDGRSFRDLLDGSPGGLPVDRVVDLAIEVADALAYAHAQGLVHRDIKPANLMALAGGGVKICDFGIARLPETTSITGRGVPGTAAYMAPEQSPGAIDARADMYALGRTLYVLLTGGHASSTSPDGISRELGAARSDIPPRLEQLLVRLLALDPAERPDAAMLRDRLTALRDGREGPSGAWHLRARARETHSYGRPGDAPSPPSTRPRTATRRRPSDPDLFTWPEVREPRAWVARAAVASAPAWFLINAGQFWYQLPARQSWFTLFCVVVGTYALGAMTFVEWDYPDRRSSAGQGDDLPDRPGLFGGLMTVIALLIALLFYGVGAVTGAGGDRWLMLVWTLTGLVSFTIAFSTRWVHSYESGMRHLTLREKARCRAIAGTVASTVWFGEPYEDPRLPGLADLLSGIPAARFFRLEKSPFSFAVVCGPRVLLVATTTWPPGVYQSIGYKELLRDGRSFASGAQEAEQIRRAESEWLYQLNKRYRHRRPDYSDVDAVLVVGPPSGGTGEVVLGDHSTLSLSLVTCTTPAGFAEVVRSRFREPDRIDLPTVARVLDHYDRTQDPAPDET
ncbi:serine/threonine-protein kinase [Actinomadura luteofluorescens]|uniref:serine/threonine-protein kinase n=1 Tax=Actinomadura luteofluorescens TaxID=46163 RepID=UPI003D934929